MKNIRDYISLKACRIIANIDAKELADAVGVTVDTIYKWEKNRSYPNAPQLLKIMGFFAQKGWKIDVGDIKFF